MPNFIKSLPRPAYWFNSVFAPGAESSVGQFRGAEAALRRAHEWLVLRRLSRRSTHDLPPRTYDHIYPSPGFRAQGRCRLAEGKARQRSEEHTSELQSPMYLV